MSEKKNRRGEVNLRRKRENVDEIRQVNTSEQPKRKAEMMTRKAAGSSDPSCDLDVPLEALRQEERGVSRKICEPMSARKTDGISTTNNQESDRKYLQLCEALSHLDWYIPSNSQPSSTNIITHQSNTHADLLFGMYCVKSVVAWPILKRAAIGSHSKLGGCVVNISTTVHPRLL